jgi:hypothetical protein
MISGRPVCARCAAIMVSNAGGGPMTRPGSARERDQPHDGAQCSGEDTKTGPRQHAAA